MRTMQQPGPALEPRRLAKPAAAAAAASFRAWESDHPT